MYIIPSNVGNRSLIIIVPDHPVLYTTLAEPIIKLRSINKTTYVIGLVRDDPTISICHNIGGMLCSVVFDNVKITNFPGLILIRLSSIYMNFKIVRIYRII